MQEQFLFDKPTKFAWSEYA